MTPQGETLKKFTGDLTEEVPDAAYRLAASVFVEAVTAKAINLGVKDASLKRWLSKNKEISEFVVGFVLSMVLEFIPIESIDDERKRLAYNLRVRSWEELGDRCVDYVRLEALPPLRQFIVKQADGVIRLAKGDVTDEELVALLNQVPDVRGGGARNAQRKKGSAVKRPSRARRPARP